MSQPLFRPAVVNQPERKCRYRRSCEPHDLVKHYNEVTQPASVVFGNRFTKTSSDTPIPESFASFDYGMYPVWNFPGRVGFPENSNGACLYRDPLNMAPDRFYCPELRLWIRNGAVDNGQDVPTN